MEEGQKRETVKLSSIDLDDDILVDEDDLLSSYNTLMSGLSIPNKTIGFIFCCFKNKFNFFDPLIL